MTTAMTNYLEDALLNHMLRNTSYTSPATVYVGLLTADPTESGLTTSEISGFAYQRQSATFSAPVGNTTSNSVVIQFPVATGTWGVISHVAIFDALSGGNMLFYGPLTTTKTVNLGDSFKFNATALSVTIN